MAMFGSLTTMVGSTPFLCFGRFFVGLGGGTANVVFGKMITETLPEELASKFLMAHNGSFCVGFVVVFGLGALLPDPEDVEAMKDDQMWRVIYLVPFFVGVIEILLIIFVYKYEPIAFCIMTGRDDEGKAHMAKVYRKKDDHPDSTNEVNSKNITTLDQLLSEKYKLIKRSTTMDATSTNFSGACCGSKYAKGTWVCIMINTFNQQSGINAINVYANRLL